MVRAGGVVKHVRSDAVRRCVAGILPAIRGRDGIPNATFCVGEPHALDTTVVKAFSLGDATLRHRLFVLRLVVADLHFAVAEGHAREVEAAHAAADDGDHFHLDHRALGVEAETLRRFLSERLVPSRRQHRALQPPVVQATLAVGPDDKENLRQVVGGERVTLEERSHPPAPPVEDRRVRLVDVLRPQAEHPEQHVLAGQ